VGDERPRTPAEAIIVVTLKAVVVVAMLSHPARGAADEVERDG
jgi:hypothetical protein